MRRLRAVFGSETCSVDCTAFDCCRISSSAVVSRRRAARSVVSCRLPKRRRRSAPNRFLAAASPPERSSCSASTIFACALPRLICYRASIDASEFLRPKGGTLSMISPGRRRELAAAVAVAEQDQRSTSAERGSVLDEFVALTGNHRKHAIRVLNGNSLPSVARRGRRCLCDEAVNEGLVVLWEASDRVCGKRLKALLPMHSSNRATCPLTRGCASISCRSAPPRSIAVWHQRARQRPVSAVGGVQGWTGSVSVRTFGDWQDPTPRFVEADSLRIMDRS